MIIVLAWLLNYEENHIYVRIAIVFWRDIEYDWICDGIYSVPDLYRFTSLILDKRHL